MFNYKIISIIFAVVALVLASLLVAPRATEHYIKQGYELCLNQVRVEMFTSLRDRGYVPITVGNTTIILRPDGQQ